MSYIVAVTRWYRPLDEELPHLAAELGVAAYDLRLRLAGPIPVIVSGGLDVTRGLRLMGYLRGRGHGAVICDGATVPASGDMPVPRDYAFEPAHLLVSAPAWGERHVAYRDVIALIRATEDLTVDTKTETTKKKTSLARMALSSGLMRKKKVTRRRHDVSHHSEQVLYLVAGSEEDRLLLRAHRLRHRHLGEDLAPSAHANFATMVSLLRQRAPEAFYDERLLQGRKESLLGMRPVTGGATVRHGNASANDLAAHLLVAAYLQEQL